METVERAQLFTQLLEEIDSMDETLFPPKAKRGEDEELIGVVVGWTRKVFALANMYGREAARQAAEYKYDQENMELRGKCSLLAAKHEVLLNLFWACARSEHDAWGKHEQVGIRENWQFVESTEDEGMRGFISGMLGR